MSLRRLAEEDLERVRTWRNATEIRRWMYAQHEIGEAEHRAWFDGLQGDPTRSWWVYEEPQRGPCGVVSFTNCDMGARTASWGGYVAPGEVRGTGSRMLFASIEKAFSEWGLFKLTCEALALNEVALNLYRKAGFVDEGRFRSQYFDGQKRHDVIRLGLLADEWQSHRPSMIKRITSLDGERAAGRVEVGGCS